MSESAIELSDANFEKETKSGAILVDFWASWCGPCRAIAPVIDELAVEMKGKVKFGKVNVDEQSALAEKFEVSSIPSLIIFKGGKPVANRVGAASKGTLKEWIESSLK